MHVVEIAFFPASDSFIADPSLIKAPVANIIARTPGFISAHAGLQVEDPKTGYLAIVWESLEAHQKFTVSPIYAELGAQLEPSLSGPLKVQYIEFLGNAIPAFESPVTELATAVMKEGNATEDLVSHLQSVVEHTNHTAGMASEGMFGRIIEEPRTFDLLPGRESVEALTAATKAGGPGPEALRRFFELVDISVVHVKFTKTA